MREKMICIKCHRLYQYVPALQFFLIYVRDNTFSAPVFIKYYDIDN